MNAQVQMITWQGIAWAFVPVTVAVAILVYWTLKPGTAVYAIARMLVQLIAVGFVLAWVFEGDNALVITAVLFIMVVAASWIAMRPLEHGDARAFYRVLTAIVIGGGLTLALVTQLSIGLDPWYYPRYMIPLAGMIFANAMNSVSLCAERLEAEMRRGESYEQSRRAAMHAALIPLLNSLFAVGLVSLPGMMTGQILSGVEPVIAARYQIVVMCMIFAASTLSAAIYAGLYARHHCAGEQGCATD